MSVFDIVILSYISSYWSIKSVLSIFQPWARGSPDTMP